MALYEANDSEMAESTETAVIKTLDLAGEKSPSWLATRGRFRHSGQRSLWGRTLPEYPPRPN